MVFSYLLGANPLWRVAQSLLVGVSVGYVTLVILTQVLAPHIGRVVAPAPDTAAADRWLALVPVVLGLLLLLRIVYPGAWPASFALNLVVVVGASLAVGGALAGTIVPQTLDTMRPLGLTGDAAGIARAIGNVVLVAGVVCALSYFAFTVGPDNRRPGPVRALAAPGRWVLVIAFGSILGSLATTFYAALIDQLYRLIQVVQRLVGL